MSWNWLKKNPKHLVEERLESANEILNRCNILEQQLEEIVRLNEEITKLKGKISFIKARNKKLTEKIKNQSVELNRLGKRMGG